jgi:hypothetical protein
MPHHCKKSIIGTYKGCVTNAEGYRDNGQFYDLDGNPTTLAGVTTKTKLTLNVEVVSGGVIWGTYSYYNSLEGYTEVDNFHGAYVGDDTYLCRDKDEVIMLAFDGKCVKYTNVEGQSTSHTARPGYFEAIVGSLKKC